MRSRLADGMTELSRVRGADGVPITAAGLLDLEQIEATRFRAWHNQRNHAVSLFGGQALAQGLAAAMRTTRWPAHSLHAYFLRGGVPDQPVDYDVTLLRDGRRFAARSVTASQAGRIILEMSCSFHDAEPGMDHQVAAPADAPLPEDLQTLRDFVQANADRLPDTVVRSYYDRHFPIELKCLDTDGIFYGRLSAPSRAYWMRLPSAAGIDDVRAQQCLLAFLSDYWLAGVAAGLHRSPLTADGFTIASLDHSIWFHRSARADDWLLCRTDSPSAQDGRGLARGLIYDRAGRLVASTAQEAVMRLPD